MEIIKNTGNYIVFGKDAELDEGIWTDYQAEMNRKIREYIEDLNSGESDPAGGLPRKPCGCILRHSCSQAMPVNAECKASFRQGPRKYYTAKKGGWK